MSFSEKEKEINIFEACIRRIYKKCRKQYGPHIFTYNLNAPGYFQFQKFLLHYFNKMVNPYIPQGKCENV